MLDSCRSMITQLCEIVVQNSSVWTWGTSCASIEDGIAQRKIKLEVKDERWNWGFNVVSVGSDKQAVPHISHTAHNMTAQVSPHSDTLKHSFIHIFSNAETSVNIELYLQINNTVHIWFFFKRSSELLTPNHSDVASMLQKQKSQTYIHGFGFAWRVMSINCNPQGELVENIDALVAKAFENNISIPRL